MRWLFERVRFVGVVGVLFGLLAALTAFGVGGWKTVKLVTHVLRAELDGVTVELVAIMDAFLLAAALLVFALGLYELFLGKLELPKALVIEDFDELKSKLGSVIVLVLAVAFLERLEAGGDALALLYQGIATACIGAMLIAFTRSHKR